MRIKNKIVWFLSSGFLLFPIFVFASSWDDSYSSGVGGAWGLSNPYGLPEGTILGIVSNLLFWLLSIFALAGIIGFVLSGIFYLISAGNEDMVKNGKEGMKWSIVGVIVGLSGFVIMQAVSMMLGGASKNF
ncbi:MAG: hypothetical protein HGA61_01405 [Candidatus Moranbacteria bacterium]|nr:hypothetical protein [Candidatus Moranbacteria bacterium]